MASAPDKHAILISGAPGSGVSAVSRAISFLGYSEPLPSIEINPADTGDYVQKAGFTEVNNRFVEMIGGSWRGLPPLVRPSAELAESWEELLDRLRLSHMALARQAITRGYSADAKRVVCADTRIALFAPFWQAAFEAEGFAVDHVLAYRSPYDIVASHDEGAAVSPKETIQAWAVYILRVLNQAVVARSVDVTELSNFPGPTLNRLARGLEITSRDAVSEESLRLIAELCGERANEGGEVDLKGAPELVIDILGMLRNWRGSHPGLRRKAARCLKIAEDAQADVSAPEGPSVRSARPRSSKERPFVLHYHLFKNAGTSVDASLKANFGDGWRESEFPPMGRHANAAAVESWILEHPEALALSSHSASMPLPAIDGVNVAPVIFIRHPIDRIRSAYAFERNQKVDTQGAQLASAGTFADYVRALLATSSRQCRNYQTSRLSRYFTGRKSEIGRAMRALQYMPFVGLVEDFPESMRRMEVYLREYFPQFTSRQVKANSSRESAPLGQRLSSIAEELGPELWVNLVEANCDDLLVFAEVAKRYDLEPPVLPGA